MKETLIDQDCSAAVSAVLDDPGFGSEGGLDVASTVELLLPIEKQARSGGDYPSVSRILLAIVGLCRDRGEWTLLNENILLLSKRRGQLKQAVAKMVQKAMTYIEEAPDKDTRLKLLEVLRTVTEGKIYVEVERATLTQQLSKMRESDGDVKGATEIMQDLQVETFGSMDKKAKVAFILEQFRLTLLNKDFVRAGIICKKVSTRFFKDESEDVQQLKLKFYQLMIKLASGIEPAARALNTCRYYRSIFETPCIQADAEKASQILSLCCVHILLAPFDSEQADLLERVYEEPKLKGLPQLKELLTRFRTYELILWKDLESKFGTYLREQESFKAGDENGDLRWKELKHRTVEHNMRVMAKYYTRVSMKRLCELTDLPKDEAEEFLSKLVQIKTIFAKYDRPSGIISFSAVKSPDEVLNDWSDSLSDLMVLVEKTKHMIVKEEMNQEI